MFKKDISDASHYDTIISAKTEVVGDIHVKGGLQIEGTVKGNIIAVDGSGAKIRIANTGLVEGEIRVPNMIINGTVQGNVYSSEYIELAKQARINGDLYYSMMEMVLGAAVNGKLVHQDKNTKKQTTPPIKVAKTEDKPS
jgi:cytoskeletal protein CcmA (bactofilin family)